MMRAAVPRFLSLADSSVNAPLSQRGKCPLLGEFFTSSNANPVAYEYGGIDLNGWFFGGTRAPIGYITTKSNTPTAPNWEGWLHTF